MTTTKSRYCRKCDAKFRWQCECNPRIAMAWQRENVFKRGKRYKGKEARLYCDGVDGVSAESLITNVHGVTQSVRKK